MYREGESSSVGAEGGAENADVNVPMMSLGQFIDAKVNQFPETFQIYKQKLFAQTYHSFLLSGFV